MSKAAVVQLTKILACEWAKDAIRVNGVAPWVTLTPLLVRALGRRWRRRRMALLRSRGFAAGRGPIRVLRLEGDSRTRLSALLAAVAGGFLPGCFRCDER